MRRLAVLFVTFVLTACSTAPVTKSGAPAASPARATASGTPGESLDSVVEFLLAAAATDFHAHRPPDPIRFRNVRVGHLPAPGGEPRYLMCGEFLPAQGGEAAEWTPFATIRTSGYEQWIGATASTYCENPSVVWEPMRDLSNLLQRRFAALR